MGWYGYYDHSNDSFADSWAELCRELGLPEDSNQWSTWEEEHQELLARTAFERAQRCQQDHMHNEYCNIFERGVFTRLTSLETLAFPVGLCMPDLAEFIRPVVVSNLILELEKKKQGTSTWASPSGRVAALAKTLDVIDATMGLEHHAYKTINLELGEEVIGEEETKETK